MIGTGFGVSLRDLLAKLLSLSFAEHSWYLASLAEPWRESAIPGGDRCEIAPVECEVPLRIRDLSILGRSVIWGVATGPRGCSRWS